MNKLYAVLLGGKIRKENLMEDHQLVFVVASDELQARKLAKKKWPNAESIHVDGTQALEQIDGYQVILKKEQGSADIFLTDNEYSE